MINFCPDCGRTDGHQLVCVAQEYPSLVVERQQALIAAMTRTRSKPDTRLVKRRNNGTFFKWEKRK